MDPQNGSVNSSNADTSNIQAIIDQIKQNIWTKRPILEDIMTKHGNKTLYDYAKDFLDVNPAPLLDTRKSELIDTVKELLTIRLGSTVASEVAEQLRKLPLVSTADHHGPINNPYWTNCNIITALPSYNSNENNLKYIIDFSFASVSMNNASAFPRGIELHSNLNNPKYIRLPIFPDKLKMSVVYATRAFNEEDIQKAILELNRKQKEYDMPDARKEMLIEYINKYYRDSDTLSAPDFNSQITKINFKLWPKLFHKESGEANEEIPNLIYLEIETIITELLIKYHLNNPNSLINKLLFNPNYQKLVFKYFDSIPGSFSLENKWGTYMFWGIDEKGHRVPLMLENGKLHSPEFEFDYNFNGEEMTNALRNKKIFPSMMLSYLITSLYYGMKCLGGFCQVNDLTLTKYAWQNFLREIGENNEAEAIEPIQTKEFGGNGSVLVYCKTSQNKLVNATGVDMLLDKDSDTSFERYLKLSKKLTLMETMEPMLPEMYIVLYPSYERNEEFAKITTDQISTATGLYDKIIEEMKMN